MNLRFILIVLIASGTVASAQVTTTGYSNVARTEAPGTLLSHPITNGSEPIGRTTSINYLNGWVIIGPEQPGARAGSDLQMRVYDVSNPTAPLRRLPSDFGLSYANESWHLNNFGWNAHGTAQVENMLLPNVVRVNGFGGLVERGGTNGIPQNGQLLTGYNRSSQAGPWDASFPWYGTADDTFYIRQPFLQGGGTRFRTLATFDHVGAFGGGDWHPMFFGDLLIYARSGGSGRDGVVVYRMLYEDFDDPQTRRITPQYVGSLSSGFTGYWPVFYSDGTALYVIGAGTNVVMVADITSATIPGGEDAVTLAANLTVPGLTNAPYPVFQDHFGFIHNRKIDMNRLVAGDASPIVLTLNENNPPVPSGQPAAPSGVDTSQMSLALGNLWLTGGYPSGTFGQPNYQAQGMGIWVHQQASDTNPPRVSYHIPQSGRTHYPRHAPLSFLIFEHGSRGAPRNGIDFTVRPVQAGNALGAAVEGFLIHDFSGVLTFTPTQGLAEDTTYQVDFLSQPEAGIGWRDAAGNFIEPYSFRFATGGGISAVAPPVWTSFSASDYQPSPGQPVTFTAAATGTGLLEYRFQLEGIWTAWSTTSNVDHAFAHSGRPKVLAQVRDPAGNVVTHSLNLLVLIPPPTNPRPTQSSSMTLGDDFGVRRLWSVNPDANTVAVIDAITGLKVAEHAVGENPRSIARDANGRYWVTCFASDEIRLLNADGTLHQTLALEYGDGPFGIAPSPDGQAMYVTLYSAGQVNRYAVAAPGAPTHTASQLTTPRAIAVSADGQRVLITRFLSSDLQGEVSEFNATLGFTRLFPLALANTADGGDRAAGVPNYLAGIAISPDGMRASVVGKQDNILRGLAFGVGDLTHETTVRSIITFLDLVQNTEVRHARRDFDNSDSPSAITYTPTGDSILVTLQGNNTLVGMDAMNLLPLNEPLVNGSMVTQPAVLTMEVGTGLAPQGVIIDVVSQRLFTQNFMGRNVSVFNAHPLLAENRTSLPLLTTTNTVASEPLPANVLLGKRIFYNAADPRMSADSYISCASCHVDGGHDGRVWDFTGRGEGLRRTTDLRGRRGMGHGAVHWSGNFDEIQDFEHDIRGPFGGMGFMALTPQQFSTQHPSPATGKSGLSSDLDALAAYVTSLTPEHTPRSPHRQANGSFTTSALAGQALFAAMNCASCHSGSSFTNSSLMNVGTQSLLSGSRLGQELGGIDTPTLHGLHATRVYLHHGQAATLSEVFSYSGGTLRYGAQAQHLGASGPQADQPQEGGGGFFRGAFGGATAYLSTAAPASVRFNQIDGGSGGSARIAFRYVRQYNGGPSTLLINGVSQSITLLMQSPNNDWQTSGWRWFLTEAPLNPGTANTIEIVRADDNPLQVNALLVANADQLELAQPHRSVQSLSSQERSQLMAYLMQLDGRDASGAPLAAPDLPDPLPPTILSGPTDLTLAEGNPLHFAVTVSGTGPFIYEWRRGTTVLMTNLPELMINSVTAGDAGFYTCTVSNAQGSAISTPAAVSVNAALSLTTTSLAAAKLEQNYFAMLSATGGVSTRTWSVLNGTLPPGITLSSGGVLSGIPLVAGRAEFTVQVSDSSGSSSRTLMLDAMPVGGFVNDPDLLLHYTFDEGSGSRVWDSATASYNHATTVNNAHWVSDGRFGGAYGPASSGAVLNSFIPANQSDLNFNPRGDAFSLSLWCRTTTTNSYTTLISKDGGDPYRIQYRLWTASPTSMLQGIHGHQYGGSLNTSPSLNDGQWHLITLVNAYESNIWRTRVYYDDGTLSTSFNTGAGGTVADLMRIGGLSAGWNQWFGQIDDLRIYKRALTPAEISALYNAPQPETFGGWRRTHLTAAQQANPMLSGPAHDADGNGIANLIEFIAPQLLSIHPADGITQLSLSRNSLARGVTLMVESSTDLQTWLPLATSINGAPATGPATIQESSGVIRSLTIHHATTPPSRFYRLRAVLE